jgi:hypothetical protein
MLIYYYYLLTSNNNVNFFHTIPHWFIYFPYLTIVEKWYIVNKIMNMGVNQLKCIKIIAKVQIFSNWFDLSKY